MALKHLQRLHAGIIASGVAIVGVDTDGIVTPTTLQTAAQPVIDAFDDSVSAQGAWEASRVPERKDLRDQAAQAVADLDAFLAITSPTQAQTLAVVKKLCQQNKRIIARLIQVD